MLPALKDTTSPSSLDLAAKKRGSSAKGGRNGSDPTTGRHPRDGGSLLAEPERVDPATRFHRRYTRQNVAANIATTAAYRLPDTNSICTGFFRSKIKGNNLYKLNAVQK